MSHNEMLSTRCLHADESIEDTLSNTKNTPMLHAIEMYLVVFMVSKSLSESWGFQNIVTLFITITDIIEWLVAPVVEMCSAIGV